MLSKEFNKFSGTEIRTKYQVRFYLMLIEWIRSRQKEGKFSKEDWDSAYKKWVKREEIYSYQNDKKIKTRFGFIISNLKKIGINYQGGVFDIPKHIDHHIIFNKMINYKNNHNVKPFKAMIDFAIANPDKHNAKKIILAFQVYDGKESFASLYDMDVIDELAKQEKELLKFKKPPKEKEYIEKIAQKLKTSQTIVVDDLIGYESLSSRIYIRNAFLNAREKFNLDVLITRINASSYENFVYQINKNKISALLKKEYFDLFSRWLFDFKLIDTSGTKAKVFYNSKLKKANGDYQIANKKVSEYPFTFDETRAYILKIAQNDFGFKNHRDELKKIGNSIIAEYFVNLFCCFKLKIKPVDFTIYVKTKVTKNLLPIFTAPGGKPDMSYFATNNLVVNVETTILKTEMQVKKNEIFPSTDHLVKIVEKENFQKSYLIFVSPLDPKVYKKDFNLIFNDKIPQGKLIMHNFRNLLHFDFSKIINSSS